MFNKADFYTPSARRRASNTFVYEAFILLKSKHPMNTVLQSPVSGIAVQVLDFFKKTGATFQR